MTAPGAGGTPLCATPGGRRVLGLLRALTSGLALDETVRVLPWLRRATQARDDPNDRLSPSRAREIAYGIGMAGLQAARGSCLDWAGRLRRRRDRLRRELDAGEHAPTTERRRRAIEHQAARRWLKDVEPILPGIEALQELATAAIAAPSPAIVGASVAAFVQRCLRMPAEPADLLETLTTVAASDRAPTPPDGDSDWAATRALIAALGDCQVQSAAAAAAPIAGTTKPEVVEPARMRALLAALGAPTPGVFDGMIDADAWATVVPPGLSPQRPLSATGVAALLACPYRFLLERILFLREPPRTPPSDMLAPIVYGQLFHTAAERFFAVAGPGLCGRERSLEYWSAVAAEHAGAVLDEHFLEQPLRSSDAQAGVRNRMAEQMRHLVVYEWSLPPRTFEASEATFGDPEPVALVTEQTTLYVRGAVDRIDRLTGTGLALRDLKTGRLWSFEAEPMNPTRDLQLGLYVLALEAPEARLAERVVTAAYVSPTAPETVERRFAGADLEGLRARTRDWLDIAGALLRAGTLPRTPRAAECATCAFRIVCGDWAWARSRAQMARLPRDHPAARYARLALDDPDPGVETVPPAPSTGAGWMLRRLLLGLRALADRDDGVAELALLGPPFFAVDLSDLVTERAAPGVAVPPDRARRMDAARAVVDALRRHRHDRSPGTVGLDLIAQSGLGRVIATAADTARSAALLRNAAAQLDWLARRERVDFDAASEKVRDWLAAPDWTDSG